MKSRFIVFEQEKDDTSRVGDCFGVFYSHDKAVKLCKQLQTAHPAKWYGIRQLLHGWNWKDDSAYR